MRNIHGLYDAERADKERALSRVGSLEQKLAESMKDCECIEFELRQLTDHEVCTNCNCIAKLRYLSLHS